MLASKNRITKPDDFDAVKKNGKRVSTKDLVFSYFFRNDSNPNRFGIIVTKKIDSRAVARNRTTRLIREAIKHNLDNIKPGHDIVVIANKIQTDLNSCEAQIREALSKSKLLS